MGTGRTPHIIKALTRAWAHYVNSNNLLSELRGLTSNSSFSSECLDEAKWMVISDTSSSRSWNYCWLVLQKVKNEYVVFPMGSPRRHLSKGHQESCPFFPPPSFLFWFPYPRGSTGNMFIVVVSSYRKPLAFPLPYSLRRGLFYASDLLKSVQNTQLLDATMLFGYVGTLNDLLQRLDS